MITYDSYWLSIISDLIKRVGNKIINVKYVRFHMHHAAIILRSANDLHTGYPAGNGEGWDLP